MALGKLPVPGRPTIWITVGQRPIALAVGAGRGCLDIFTLLNLFSPLSPSLWETARYRLKYCLKRPLNPKQPTKQIVSNGGWLGGAKVLGKLPVPGRPTSLDQSRARAYCTCNRCGWGLFGHLWETARYRLKYCLKGPLNPKQPTKQIVSNGGWLGGAKVLGKLPVPGRPTSLDQSRARAYCTCNRCGWGLFGHFFCRLSLRFSFSHSLGDDID